MKTIAIKTVLDELLAKNNHSRGSGRIWIELGDEKFPEANWADFLFIVLAGWSHEMSSFISNPAASRCVFRFVDGNYAFELTRSNGVVNQVTCGQWNAFDEFFEEKSFTFSACFTVLEFAEELNKANQKVIAFAQEHRLASEYSERLEQVSAGLSRLMAEGKSDR